MNSTRRKLLLGALSCKILLPFIGAFTSTVKASEYSCPIHPETLKIINNLYGNTPLTISDRNNFNFNIENLGRIFYPEKNTYKYTAENSDRMNLIVRLDPMVVHGPISIIVEKYNNISGTFLRTVNLAKFQTNGKVSKIRFSAAERESNKIKIFAVALMGKSVVYTCLQVHLIRGDEGCC